MRLSGKKLIYRCISLKTSPTAPVSYYEGPNMIPRERAVYANIGRKRGAREFFWDAAINRQQRPDNDPVNIRSARKVQSSTDNEARNSSV